MRRNLVAGFAARNVRTRFKRRERFNERDPINFEPTRAEVLQGSFEYLLEIPFGFRAETDTPAFPCHASFVPEATLLAIPLR